MCESEAAATCWVRCCCSAAYARSLDLCCIPGRWDNGLRGQQPRAARGGGARRFRKSTVRDVGCHLLRVCVPARKPQQPDTPPPPPGDVCPGAPARTCRRRIRRANSGGPRSAGVSRGMGRGRDIERTPGRSPRQLHKHMGTSAAGKAQLCTCTGAVTCARAGAGAGHPLQAPAPPRPQVRRSQTLV